MSTVHLPRLFPSIEPSIRGSRYLIGTVLGAIAFWALSILVAGFFSKFYFYLAREDGVLEYAQVAILLGSSCMAGYVAVLLSRAQDRVWATCYALAALVLLWLAGEEISWGQRIFGLSTPAVLAPNVQGELNLHNLPGVTLQMHRLLKFALVVVCILSVAIWTRAPAVRRRWRVHLWLPHPILIGIWLCFLSLSLVQALDRWYFGLDHMHYVVSELQESAELILYFGVLVFLMMVALRVREERQARPAG